MPRQLHPLVRPPSSARNVLKTRARPGPKRLPGLLDAPEELGMVLKPVLEPVLLRLEPDQDPCRAAMPRDQDLLIRSQFEIPGEVILHLCQSHPARLG